MKKSIKIQHDLVSVKALVKCIKEFTVFVAEVKN
jgi:hypothetical protein